SRGGNHVPLYRGGGPHDLCIQATVHRFRGYTGVNPECAQLLFMHYVRSGIFRQSAAITTNIAHLTSERLRPIPFILPPVAEQRELARRARKLLDGVTHLAALSTAAATELKALDEATLAAAFRGELLEARREVD